MVAGPVLVPGVSAFFAEIWEERSPYPLPILGSSSVGRCGGSREIGKDFNWAKRFLGVGETGFQSPCGLSRKGVKRFPPVLEYKDQGSFPKFLGISNGTIKPIIGSSPQLQD